MQHRPLAKNGHEHEYAWSRGYTERFQPHGTNAGRSCLLLEELDWDKTLALGPHGTPHRVAER